MANHSATKKSIRQTAYRTQVNRNRLSRVRTFMRRVEEAILSGDKAKAQAEFKTMQSELQRAEDKNLFHRNTVARKISRVNARIKLMA